MSHWRLARLLRRGNGGREGARGGSFREAGGPEELLSAGPEPPPGGEAQEKLARRHGRRRRRRLRVCAYCLRSNLHKSERWRRGAALLRRPRAVVAARRRWKARAVPARAAIGSRGETADPAGPVEP